jgi:hypothetical protein
MSPTGQLPYYHALINPRVSFDLFAFGKQLMKLRVLPHYMDSCPKLRVTSGLDGELECSKDNWDQLRSLLRQKRVKKEQCDHCDTSALRHIEETTTLKVWCLQKTVESQFKDHWNLPCLPLLFGETNPLPFGGGGDPLLPWGMGGGGPSRGKGPWRRVTCGWLDFGKVKQPCVGAVGYSLP